MAIKKRIAYLNRKLKQVDQCADAHKYTHRLGRLMQYHRRLSELEAVEIEQILQEGRNSTC